MPIVTFLLGNWRPLMLAASAALIAFLLWRVDSLSADLETTQAAHATAVETANANAAEAQKLAAEVTRMNGILAQREAALTASRSQINAAKRAAMEAKNGDQDAPAAPLWNGVLDGLYGPSNHTD
ncbi:hypothetical protein [Azospirillum brasilense]|uniref:hypothetical protein n=1 Tax=Azospirillum brasilense TaxID=192 RepID=UPI000E681624|nr:hypothetical protein [Azospirillum brasilense]NUB24699.1 hypothetical protein [Azospirillum brasilense]NUB30697.1 hypothetical protein [Azospirillum brasilense]RIW08306.1 hypothetical protein D2T81_00925 [Azospirillum brasilense]